MGARICRFHDPFLFGAMAFFAIPHWLTGTVVQSPLALTFPAFTLFNFNILGKMGFGALAIRYRGDLRRRMSWHGCRRFHPPLGVDRHP